MTTKSQSIVGTIPRHRACDECRTRKLACSKEPEGCARCKREGIPCFYSPQKPMGRPRKRRHADEDAGRPSSRRSKTSPTTTSQPISPFTNTFDTNMQPHSMHSPRAALHQQSLFIQQQPMDFIEQQPGVSFFDGMPDYYSHSDMSMPTTTMATTSADNGTLAGLPNTLSAPFDFSNNMFDPSAYHSEDSANPPSLYVPSHFSASPEAPASPPSDAAGPSDTSVYHLNQPRKPAPTVSCGCVSSLNFALESLSHLPQDISTAMRVVRSAAKVAHDVASCMSCSGFNRPVTEPIPIQGFQSFMILGALVPSACNAYAAIMEMVHNEVALAKAEKRTLYFSLREIGGYWETNNIDEAVCAELNLNSFDNQFLAPDVWRGVVCSILRLDVYGNPKNVAYDRRKGLREVLHMLEQKSNERHAEMDHLASLGQMPKQTGYLFCQGNQMNNVNKDDRHCMRILHMARIALNNLVIA